MSFCVLAAALFVILSGFYDSVTQTWAYGIAGSILSYWLGVRTS